MTKEIPDNCPYTVEKGEQPHFIEYCSGYSLPNVVCNKCRKFFKNYWKDRYGTEWKAGTSRVKHALKVLKKNFPNLSIEPTKYAVSEEYIPPSDIHEKHEPNIIIAKGKSIICDIEVTGSDIGMEPPNDIFILKGKFLTAQKRKREESIETWFYTIYRNSEYVLDLHLIEKFDSEKAEEKYLKGVPEWYIEIPCADAYPKEKLFEWLKKKIS